LVVVVRVGLEEHTGDELSEETRNDRTLRKGEWVGEWDVESRPGKWETYLPDKGMYANDVGK